MKRGILILLILLFSVFFSFSVSAAVINVPGDYPSIQAAVGNATNGDTINVAAGTYNENVVVNKEVEIIGTNAVVNGASDAAFEIRANNVKIQGFNITTTGTFTGGAVEVYSSNNVDILENNIETSNAVIGIWICGSNNGCVSINNLDIKNNNIKINGVSTGIYADFSNPAHNNWLIQENDIDSAGVNLELYDVKNVNVKENIFEGNGNSVSVVYSSEFSDVSNADFINNSFLGNGDISGVTPSFWIESDFANVGGNTGVDNILIQENEFFNWINAGIKIGEPPGVGTFNNVSNVVINYNGFNSGTGPAVDNRVNDTIIDGRYNWWGNCTGPGPVASGGGNRVSVNVTYTPWLGACIENKTIEPSCVLKTDNATLYANVTGYCVDNVKFGVNIGGIWNNYSYATQSGTIYSYILNSNLLIAGQNVLWTVYADDCYNHTTQNGIENFYVNRRTNLSVNPVSPDGLNNWFVTEPLFTLTNPDSSSIWYRWDSTGTLNYISPFNLDNISNAPPKESAGILELSYWSNVCANESEQSKLFYIDLVSPSIIDLQPVGIVYNNLKPTISAYLEELYQSNSGINKPSVVMKLDNNIVPASVVDADSLDAIVSFTPISDLSTGKHNVTVNVTDNAGRNNQTFWEFYINITPIFNLSIYSPINKPYDNPYGDKRVSFNISGTEDLEKIEFIDWNERVPKWKKLCSDCEEYGYSNRKTKTFNDGGHNITIKATDYFGQVKEINISFFIDSKEPKISIIKPVRGKVTNGSDFYVKYTEENLKEISVSWNPTQILTGCESGKNKECKIDLDLTAFNNQYIDYYFNVSDYVRSIQSRVTRVLVDTTSPILTVNLPNETSYGRSVAFNLSVSEKVRLEYYDNSELSPRWRNLCSNCDEYGNSRKKIRSFSRGTHNILIRALDKAGNSDVEEVSFEVDY